MKDKNDIRVKDKNDIRGTFSVVATMLSWALMSLLFVIFYSACLRPSRQVLISVNSYGEMKIELLVFAFIWLLATWNLVVTWKRKL